MKKGFSLIELVISLAIISFLALILSNLFSLNINILNKSYRDEKEYKEAYTTMAYIDTTIRRSHKIEIDNHENSNFTGYIMVDGKDISSFYFYSKDGFLYIKRSSVHKDSKGTSNKICECGDLDLFYNLNEEIIDIRIKSKNGTYTFESAVYVGDKLWKRLLLAYMSFWFSLFLA